MENNSKDGVKLDKNQKTNVSDNVKKNNSMLLES